MTQDSQQAEARSASIIEPHSSPAVLSIVSYSFGDSPEATRPDLVLRAPSAAILFLQQGALFEHCESGRTIELPRCALLGPSTRGHIWSTAPNTRFTLANLAPGAVQALFDVSPGEVRERIESLHRFAGLPIEREAAKQDILSLHRDLCSMVSHQSQSTASRMERAGAIVSSMQQSQFGEAAGNYADQFGVTPRTLQRTVQSAVGLTPKQILAIGRLRRLVTLTANGWSRTIADLAQAGGYYDQSHLRYEQLKYRFGTSSDLVCGNHIVAQSQR